MLIFVIVFEMVGDYVGFFIGKSVLGFFIFVIFKNILIFGNKKYNIYFFEIKCNLLCNGKIFCI